MTALRQLAAAVARDAGVPEDAILKHIFVAADLPPYMPYGGVLLLHALVPDMKRPMAALARLDRPLDFGAPGGYATDVALLLASPTVRPQDHLRARDAMYVAFSSDEWSTVESMS
jgi:PTS system nitrogen regulatory IIA component